jgi:hypothetical protein
LQPRIKTYARDLKLSPNPFFTRWGNTQVKSECVLGSSGFYSGYVPVIYESEKKYKIFYDLFHAFVGME